ncbi:hypothetical protein Holit_01292 [Hollandina sp. SP2]
MIETTKLQTLKNELMRTDTKPAELQKLAENKSVEIVRRIHATTKHITEAKQEADSAKAMKSGWFGKTGKKADATANAVVMTNAALSEMNDLIQESIKFTCSSIQFAQVMHKTMAYMMVNGFKDTNGQITQLSSDSKEAVQLILDEADDFVTKQLAVEKKQVEMHRRLDAKDKIDEEQNQRLEKLKTIFEDEREKVTKTFDAKDKIDEEQNQRLEKLRTIFEDEREKVTKTFDAKDKIDEEQNQRLEKLKTIFEDEREKVTKTFDAKDKIDEEQNQRLEKLKTIFEDDREKVTKTFDAKDKIDKEQSERLENLQKLLAEKDQIDEKQEKEICLFFDYTKQKDLLDKEQNGNIQKIMNELKFGVIREKAALTLSIIALIISVGTLIFFIL